MFDALKQQANDVSQLDQTGHFVDSTIILAPQHAAGVKKETRKVKH